jgi:hypothetical protein
MQLLSPVDTWEHETSCRWSGDGKGCRIGEGFQSVACEDHRDSQTLRSGSSSWACETRSTAAYDVLMYMRMIPEIHSRDAMSLAKKNGDLTNEFVRHTANGLPLSRRPPWFFSRFLFSFLPMVTWLLWVIFKILLRCAHVTSTSNFLLSTTARRSVRRFSHRLT